jgi:predicted  nucleic acid-binding Zn-ribbon protein
VAALGQAAMSDLGDIPEAGELWFAKAAIQAWRERAQKAEAALANMPVHSGLADMQSKINQLQKENNQLNIETARLQGENKWLYGQLAAQKATVASSMTQYMEEKVIATLRAENERLTSRLQDAGAYTLSERWSQQQTEIEHLHEIRKNADNEIIRLTNELKALRTIADSSADEIEQLTNRLENQKILYWHEHTKFEQLMRDYERETKKT